MNREQYNKELLEHVKLQGENPGKDFFSCLGWYMKHKKAFDESLRQKGVVFEGDKLEPNKEKPDE